jgi:hypothetical protein
LHQVFDRALLIRSEIESPCSACNRKADLQTELCEDLYVGLLGLAFSWPEQQCGISAEGFRAQATSSV